MKQGMPMPLDTRGLAFLNMFSLNTRVLILKEKVSSKPSGEADSQRDFDLPSGSQLHRP